MNPYEEEDDLPTAARKQFVKADSAPKKISQLQFGLLSPEEIQRLAEFQVTSRELFTQPSRSPAPGGCLDPRLGVSDKVMENKQKSEVSIPTPDDKPVRYPSSFNKACNDPGDSWPNRCDKTRNASTRNSQLPIGRSWISS